jgi:hypothetical protein
VEISWTPSAPRLLLRLLMFSTNDFSGAECRSSTDFYQSTSHNINRLFFNVTKAFGKWPAAF